MGIFYKDESIHLRDFQYKSLEFIFEKSPRIFLRESTRKMLSEYKLFDLSDLYNISVCKRKENEHV